jgi:hypothetical protein
VLLSKEKYSFTALKTDTAQRFVINRSTLTPSKIKNVGNESSLVRIYSDGRKIYLKNTGSKAIKGNLTVTGVTGQQILSERNIELISLYEKSLSTPGVYIITYSEGDRKYRGKVVITNN